MAETDPTFVSYRDTNDRFSMALWLNQPSTVVVWKTAVSKKAVIASVAFDWTRVDNLTVGKARIWSELFSVGDIDASQDNVRSGIEATWVGTQADLNVRAAVYAQCKRFASKFEALYKVGTGSDASPAVMAVEWALDSSHINEALEAN